MPPRYFDEITFGQAVRHEAMPILEALATNDKLHERSLRRFERDDPPAYASSTESEDLNDAFSVPSPPPSVLYNELPRELKAIMEQPLSDSEIGLIASNLCRSLTPIYHYHPAARSEERRVGENMYSHGRFNEIFRGNKGLRRTGVLVRYSMKRRWQKLGIWNPAWGFAGRNVKDSDSANAWTWRWEPQSKAMSRIGSEWDPEQLVTRALDHRRNLRYGEKGPNPTCCHLEPNVTARQAEIFFTSRPWFIFKVEVAEEQARYSRLSDEQRERHPYRIWQQVIERWKERGDWREKFDSENSVSSWKWRHESPSPEPEDFTPIHDVNESPLDATSMDFTPSEIEDFETIELPTSEQPETFWIKDSLTVYPWPGQVRKPHVPAVDSNYTSNHYLPDPFGGPEFDPFDANPRRRRASQHQRQLHMNNAQDQDHVTPPLRRSARIAGMKRRAESQPLQELDKKRRAPTVPKSGAPLPQPKKKRFIPAAGPRVETETQPRRRGRPRKVTSTKKREAATVGEADKGAAARKIAAVPRRRARRRKSGW